MMKLTTRIFIVMIMTPWTIACDYHDLGPPLAEVTCDGDEISYLNDIKPIIDANCSRCHNSGDMPTRDWTDKDILKEYADEASERVRLISTDPRHMPQIPPELSEDEIKAIVCWAEQGAPVNN